MWYNYRIIWYNIAYQYVMLATPVTRIHPEQWRMPGFFSLTMRGMQSCSLAQMITAMRLPGAVPGASGGTACLKRLLKGLSGLNQGLVD